MTTEQLDDIGAKFLRAARRRASAPQLTYDFPGFNCISVNDEVVHGVPGRARAAARRRREDRRHRGARRLHRRLGDHRGAAAVSVRADDRAHSCECARAAFKRAIKVAAAPACASPSWVARSRPKSTGVGHSVIRDLCGHGVGRSAPRSRRRAELLQPVHARTPRGRSW